MPATEHLYNIFKFHIVKTNIIYIPVQMVLIQSYFCDFGMKEDWTQVYKIGMQGVLWKEWESPFSLHMTIIIQHS